MNKEQLLEEVLEAVRNQIPQVLRDEIEVTNLNFMEVKINGNSTNEI